MESRAKKDKRKGKKRRKIQKRKEEKKRKGEAHFIGQWGHLKRLHPDVTQATMGSMALCRPSLGGDAIGTQFLRETDPMALFTVSIPHGNGKREEREGPVSKHQIQSGRGE